MTTATDTKTIIRYDLMIWSDGEMRRFDFGYTLEDALITLRAHAIVAEEFGQPPLNAEVWAVHDDVYNNGSKVRVEGI